MYGWICPQCKKVYAPTVQGCQYCNAQTIEKDTPNKPSETLVMDKFRFNIEPIECVYRTCSKCGILYYGSYPHYCEKIMMQGEKQ